MSEQGNVRLIQDIYHAFSRGNITGVLDLCDLEASLSFEGPASIPWVGNWHRREGWARFFDALGENADEITLQMEPFAAQGDNVVMVGRYQARVKRTGKRIDSPLVHLWTVRNGLVVRCQEMTNTAAEAVACTAAAAGNTGQ